MKEARPEWEVYERMVARLIADQSGADLCVTPNARVMGKISGTARQIDVLIDARHDTDNTRRLIVDAKHRRRKVDVKDVEGFLGLVNDVGATHGYLVTSSGFTKAAEKRAQMTVSIRIMPVDRLENFDPSTWPKCKNLNCNRGPTVVPDTSQFQRPIGETAVVTVTVTCVVPLNDVGLPGLPGGPVERQIMRYKMAQAGEGVLVLVRGDHGCCALGDLRAGVGVGHEI